MNSIQLNVKLNFPQLVEVIKQLTPSEKLQINSVLWEGNTDVPLEVQALVLDRVKRTRQNPELLLDWDEASKTLTS